MNHEVVDTRLFVSDCELDDSAKIACSRCDTRSRIAAISSEGANGVRSADESFSADLGDSSVKLILRMWVDGNDYWDVLFDITRRVKEAFDENGIDIPFPQHVVHMAKE